MNDQQIKHYLGCSVDCRQISIPYQGMTNRESWVIDSKTSAHGRKPVCF